MGKKVLITGGAGFIGSRLALNLIDRGHEVRVLDNLSKQIHGDKGESPLFLSIKNKVDFVLGDVNQRADWENALSDIDTIVHYAAETGTGQSMYEISHYVRTNSLGTAHLLDILVNQKHNVNKVIVASSRAVYGEGKYLCEEHGVMYPKTRILTNLERGEFEPKCDKCKNDLKVLPTDEESLISPSSVYGITKFNQEQMVLNVCRSINISAIAYRYQNVFGPGQSLVNPYTGILSIFSTLIKQGKEINIFEDGKESRDFVYIDDVVDATTLGIETEKEIYEVFNVGTGKPVSVEAVTAELMKSYGTQVPVRISGAFRLGDIRHNFADLLKINRILGFYPKYDFSSGIMLFCRWVNGQEIVDNAYEHSLKEMKQRNLYFEK